MKTEKKLFELFDYQKFDEDPQLAALIAETEGRYSRELAEDELELVSAAGERTEDLLDKDKKGGGR